MLAQIDPSVVRTFESGWALLAIAIIAVVTRYLNAFITSPDAPDWLTGLITLLLAGLGALATYLVDVKGAGTWQQALAVFVSAIVAAKGVNAADVGLEPKLKGSGFMLGRGQSGTKTYTGT